MRRSACSLVLAISVFAIAYIPPVAAQQTGTAPTANEDCGAIMQQIRNLQDALSQLSVQRQELANALDRINKDISTLQQGVKFFSGPGFSETARGEALDQLAKAMSERQQVEKYLEDVDSLIQATKDAITDLLNKLANCAPPSSTPPPNQANPAPQSPLASSPTSPPPQLQAAEDCAAIMQQIRELQDALSQLSVQSQAMANALDRINNDIATIQQSVKTFSGAGFSESARGEALDQLAKAMSERQQVEKDLEDVDSLIQATKDAITDLLGKLANCAPPSTTQPPAQEAPNPPATPPLSPSPQSVLATPGAPPAPPTPVPQGNSSPSSAAPAPSATPTPASATANFHAAEFKGSVNALDLGPLSMYAQGGGWAFTARSTSTTTIVLFNPQTGEAATTCPDQTAPAGTSRTLALAGDVGMYCGPGGLGLGFVRSNPQTGEAATITPSQTAPTGWIQLQPVPPPTTQPPGSTTYYLPGQAPQLYANPSTGQPQWVYYGSQPPSGLVQIHPMFTLPDLSSPTVSPARPLQLQTTKQPSTDYGTGGHSEQDTDSTGSVLEGRTYDSRNNLRDDTTYQYTTSNGKPFKTGSYQWDFDAMGHLSFTLGVKYDLRGDLFSTDYTSFGLHGERTAEEVTNFRADGYEINNWKIGTHLWSTQFNYYKLPQPSGSVLAQAPVVPSNTSLGVLSPLNYHPGDTITGSLWPSIYADNFKTVPGLSEYDSSIQTYTLPDGSPEWCRFKIGLPGYGYSPVRANGTFSLHIPLDWKGPLTLQTLQIDPLPNLGASSATFPIGDAVAAPTLPSNDFPLQAQTSLKIWTSWHLLDLWDEADYMEDMLDDAYDATNPDWYLIWDMEDYLDDIYDRIDEIEDDLPPSEVISLAQNMVQKATSYQTWLSSQPNLTADDQTDLKYSTHWANFLSNEANTASWLSSWNSTPLLQPYWTNPVLTQGKLGAMRGSFFGDPFDTHIRIGNFPITPIAATPTESYFMPPPGLTAGQNNYTIDSPFFPETVLPVFNMTLTMGAGQLNLHKGQSTTYFARLNIFTEVVTTTKSSGGVVPFFAGLFNGPPSYDTDLIGSSELGTIQQAAPTSRTGFISFSVTNQSSATIAMQNQFRILNASNFVPSGSNEIDGSLTAIKDGGFSILGVARANLAPEGGIGSTPGTPSSPGSSAMSGWLPTFSLNYDPNILNNSPFMTNCSAPAVPALAVSGASTTETPATTPATPAPPTSTSNPPGCPSGALIDLYNQATGNSSSVPVGDTSAIDAAKKRVDDARKKDQDAIANYVKSQTQESQAWATAFTHLPKNDQDFYYKILNRLKAASQDRSLLQSRVAANPTEKNLTDLSFAEQEYVSAADEFARLKDFIVGWFSDEDRAAWQAANDALENAENARDAAESELRDAENALGEFQRAATTK